MTPTDQNPYRSDIDGLRALAVLAVIGFHAFPGVIHGGFIGVDIFFVISGFLISTILLKDLDQNRFNFFHFFSRRIRRIFPSLILVLFACWIFGWINLLPNEYAQLGKHIAGGGLFIDNFLYWQEIGYFDQSSETKPLLHLWSLGVEEQFYLIYPFLLWLGFKKSWGLKILYALWILSFLLNIYFSFYQSSTAFFLPFTRFWEFLIGAYVALQFQKKSFAPPEQKYRNALLEFVPITGIALISISFLALSAKSIFPGFWAIAPTLGTALIIFSSPNTWFQQRILSSRYLVKIGLISYPLYLWHWPLLSFAHIMHGGTPTKSTRLACIVMAFLFAWISYKWVEYPIRFAIKQKIKPSWLACCLITLSLLGITTYLNKGFPSRIPEKFLEIQNLFNKTDNATAQCIRMFGGGGNSYCKIDDITKNPTVLLIGDSHANHFYEGLRHYYHGKGENLLSMGAGGCPPFYGIAFAKSLTNSIPLECHHYDAAFKTLFKLESIKTVIFAFDHAAHVENSLYVEFQDKISRSSVDSIVETIDTVQKSGRKVVLIYDMPDLNFDIKNCFSMRPIEIGSRSCAINDSIWKKDFDKYDVLISELSKNKNLVIFQTQPWIPGNFPIDKNGYPMYMDRTHLNSRGSLFFADKYDF